MSITFQRTFQHLVDANTFLQSGTPSLPPHQRAPTQALPSLPAPALPPPSTTDQEIKIIQGRTYSSKNLLHTGHRYSNDGKLMTNLWLTLSKPCGQHCPRHSLELRLMAATSTSARQSSGTSTNLVTRPSMKQSLLILPLAHRSTLLSTPG